MIKTKIIIAGIGGVGGYFGGLLAKHYQDNEDVEINFIVRGEHLKEIKNKGLKVIKGGDEFIAQPSLATNDPSEIGIADFLIIATKSYDLDSIIQQLKPCINQQTIILPLLNGIDAKDLIKIAYPDNIVLDGCAYIISRLKNPGVIENLGNIQTLSFGLDHFKNDRLFRLETLLIEAGIDAYLFENISSVIWEKFIFISPTATATSYFNQSIGEIVADTESFETINKLIAEVIQLAKAKQIVLPDNIVERTINKLKAAPFSATSSMHSDFKSKKATTELKSLTAYVVAEGNKYHVNTPTYAKILAKLENTNSTPTL